jgi:hypothetical protein
MKGPKYTLNNKSFPEMVSPLNVYDIFGSLHLKLNLVLGITLYSSKNNKEITAIKTKHGFELFNGKIYLSTYETEVYSTFASHKYRVS